MCRKFFFWLSAMIARRKKMPITQQPIYTAPVKYLPAVLHRNEAMGWIVEYYVLNPITDELDRKRIRLNKIRKRYRTQVDFRTAANDIVATINVRLAGGWTPFGETENSRYYALLQDVLQSYLNEKEKELKSDTMRSYNSFAKIFGEWLTKNLPACKCIFFNRTLAVRYMDDYYEHHTSNARTYNNQLKMARAFFSWAKEKCYIKENPFDLIRAKKPPQKKRIIVPANARARVRAYFEKHRPEMIIICELVYTSLIRPAEISRLTVGMLHLTDRYIYLPSDITKNAHARNAPLSDELCHRLQQHIQGFPDDYYLFGENWLPSGRKPITSKAYRKQWLSMRKELKLPDTMQLYSLRDTGIFDKLKSGIDPLTVMQAADHHDLAMTTRYGNHVDPHIIDVIAESPDF